MIVPYCAVTTEMVAGVAMPVTVEGGGVVPEPAEGEEEPLPQAPSRQPSTEIKMDIVSFFILPFLR